MTTSEQKQLREEAAADYEQRTKDFGFVEGRQARRRHMAKGANPYAPGGLYVQDHFRALGWDAGWDVEDRQLSEVSHG
jgi:hypothetical protein